MLDLIGQFKTGQSDPSPSVLLLPPCGICEHLPCRSCRHGKTSHELSPWKEEYKDSMQYTGGRELEGGREGPEGGRGQREGGRGQREEGDRGREEGREEGRGQREGGSFC